MSHMRPAFGAAWATSLGTGALCGVMGIPTMGAGHGWEQKEGLN